MNRTTGVMIAPSGKEIVALPLTEVDKNGSNIDSKVYRLAYGVATWSAAWRARTMAPYSTVRASSGLIRTSGATTFR